jgi:DNA polymerase I-like protein with 3'-5' exonuclease and polymerase domains
MRDDSVGFFWEEVQTRQKRVTYDRPIPPIPDTGWVAPTEFPRLKDVKLLGLDCETKDIELSTMGPGFRRTGEEGAYVVGLSVGTQDGGRWYFPMRHSVAPEQNLDPGKVLAWARDNLCTEGQAKVGANINYDVDALWSEGVPVTGPFIDVQYAEALLDSNRLMYNLDSLAWDYLGHGKVSDALQTWVEKAYGSDDNYRAHIHAAPPCLVGPYAEGDVDQPLRIWELQKAKLQSQSMMGLFDLETELIPLMIEMRQRGVRVDVEYAKRLDDELTQSLVELCARIKVASGGAIEPDPENEIGRGELQAFFDAAGVAYPLTAKGAPSFRKEWLDHLSHPAGELVRQHRMLRKYRNTFIRSYILDKNINGRIYALFHQLKGDENGAVSGRFSSSLPNLQNIPARDEVWGPKLRAIFLSEDGQRWFRHDWSQIEYRFLAHYARGPSGEDVRRRYNEDPTTDFHEMTLDMVGPEIGWDISTKEKRKPHRKPIKNINFGLVYGMGVDKLVDSTGLSVSAGMRVINKYHTAVPFVRKTYEVAQARAADRGYIQTILGRRQRFDLWEPRWGEGKALPYTQAVEAYGSKVCRAFTHKGLNALLQGSAADLMKLAMRDIRRTGVHKEIGVPLLTCHDELGNSADPNNRRHMEAIREVKFIMENCMTLKVPILAEQSDGKNWGECK